MNVSTWTEFKNAVAITGADVVLTKDINPNGTEDLYNFTPFILRCSSIDGQGHRITGIQNNNNLADIFHFDLSANITISNLRVVSAVLQGAEIAIFSGTTAHKTTLTNCAISAICQGFSSYDLWNETAVFSRTTNNFDIQLCSIAIDGNFGTLVKMFGDGCNFTNCAFNLQHVSPSTNVPATYQNMDATFYGCTLNNCYCFINYDIANAYSRICFSYATTSKNIYIVPTISKKMNDKLIWYGDFINVASFIVTSFMNETGWTNYWATNKDAVFGTNSDGAKNVLFLRNHGFIVGEGVEP